MNVFLVTHDPGSGTVRAYDVELRGVIKPTGQVDEHGRRAMHVDSVVRDEFVDRSVGSALAEVLGLDHTVEAGEAS